MHGCLSLLVRLPGTGVSLSRSQAGRDRRQLEQQLLSGVIASSGDPREHSQSLLSPHEYAALLTNPALDTKASASGGPRTPRVYFKRLDFAAIDSMQQRCEDRPRCAKLVPA